MVIVVYECELEKPSTCLCITSITCLKFDVELMDGVYMSL